MSVSQPPDERRPAAGAHSGPPPIPKADPWIGTIIGDRYRLVARIGTGGMALVYKGEHDLLKKAVAVKLLLPELAADTEMVARFEHEAIAAARLEHPNCVAITDFGKTPGGQLFLVMEYLDGKPLSEVSGYGKRLPWERALDVARQVLRGLARAHETGIVHRDLKPSNIMLVPREGGREVAKIIDFGIAKIFDGTSMGPNVKTKAGVVFGTADFLAPERLLGKGDTDPRSDLYSVGVLLYEMLTGKRPFHADDPYDIVKRALAEAPQPPTRAAPGVEIPLELEAVVLRALEKDPDRRFPAARDFLAALDLVVRRPGQTGMLVQQPTGTPSTPMAADPVIQMPTPPGGDVPLAVGAAHHPHPRDGHHGPLRTLWFWALVILVPLVIITLAIVVSVSGGGDPAPGKPAFGPGAKRATASLGEQEAEIARLVRQAAEGSTVETRQSAFDRLVALGYVDRVPWVDKLIRDLEQLPTCEQRAEVVAQLRKLKNPAAIAPLEQARTRAGNECLARAAAAAIVALGGLPVTQPEGAAAAAPDAGPPPTRKTSSGTRRTTPRSGGSGGHF